MFTRFTWFEFDPDLARGDKSARDLKAKRLAGAVMLLRDASSKYERAFKNGGVGDSPGRPRAQHARGNGQGDPPPLRGFFEKRSGIPAPTCELRPSSGTFQSNGAGGSLGTRYEHLGRGSGRLRSGAADSPA